MDAVTLSAPACKRKRKMCDLHRPDAEISPAWPECHNGLTPRDGRDTVLVPRTRSSRTSSLEFDRELRVQRGTRIIELLVVLRFRSSRSNVPQVLANFGIEPLAGLPLPGSRRMIAVPA